MNTQTIRQLACAVFAFGCILIIPTTNLRAQSVFGSIRGTTQDETGGAVAGRGQYNPTGMGITNGSPDASFGIVVGTGDTAFSVEQYALASLIAHGNAASQFAYQPMATPSVAYNAGTKVWKASHTRIFNNNSGGSITVKEVGLYALGYLFTGAVDSVSMDERSVLSPTVPVPNAAQLTVTYEISKDFSAID